ncbi:hypothetical protein VNO77_22100 [Canavalia gladiata]|uniref:Receptor-like serine/threonine-protein kinase n=1 Tax=Canavalia gladiata TaxID=3824 RepID=A0AAN9L2Z0_CANGL
MRGRINKILLFILAFACEAVLHKMSYAADTLTPTSSIIDDGQQLISAGQKFCLGFFSPGSTKTRYIGIWYNSIIPQTVVWVANREKPLNDSSGTLTIAGDGNIVVVDGSGNRIWSSKSSRSIQEPIAKLLDSGNLVLMDGKNGDSDSYMWQSFDYPTDTMLPGIKVGWDKTSGLNRYLTSWKSANDPSAGNFTWSFDLKAFPEVVIRQGMNITFRTGIWDGIRFNSDDWISLKGVTAFKPQILVNNDEVVYWDEPGDRLSRLVMRDDGLLQRYIWDNKILRWTKMYEVRKDLCDNYGACGINGVCNIKDVPVYCGCLKGFNPKSQEEWDSFNPSGGCIRRTPLNCTQGDEFQKLSWVKLPMLLQFWSNSIMSLEECKVECLKNCSCTAFANSAMNGGPHGCLLWFGDLIDIRLLISEEGPQLDLYVRLAASEIESTANASKRTKMALIISAPLALLLLCIIFYLHRKYTKRRTTANLDHRNQNEDQASPLFDIETILAATNNFSLENKIGEGGFGPVYKSTASISPIMLFYSFASDNLGYMSPEYAVNGHLSLKSDVFSFGIIVLEILTGIRNRNSNNNHPDHDHNLLGQAWTLWTEGRADEFMDVNLDLTTFPSELLRCLQVGLLCVQNLPEDRPTMSSVVFMLSNESIALAQPKKPGFFEEELKFHEYSDKENYSNNAMTITLLEARN